MTTIKTSENELLKLAIDNKLNYVEVLLGRYEVDGTPVHYLEFDKDGKTYRVVEQIQINPVTHEVTKVSFSVDANYNILTHPPIIEL